MFFIFLAIFHAMKSYLLPKNEQFKSQFSVQFLALQ